MYVCQKQVGIASHQSASSPKQIILEKKVACNILKDFCYLECLKDFMYGLRQGGLVHSQIIHIDLQWEFRVLSVLD